MAASVVAGATWAVSRFIFMHPKVATKVTGKIEGKLEGKVEGKVEGNKVRCHKCERCEKYEIAGKSLGR